ncbi:MAG: molybdenum ABC transporter ATP-binding protein [Candidatus Sedimenticola endophacoides]
MSLEVDLSLRRGDFHLEAGFQAPGEGVTALFGPSGCGKTSLLRAIAGLEPMARGRLRVNGDAWQSPNHFTPPHHRPLGYVFQEASLFPHLDVEQNLCFGLRRIAPRQRRVGLEEAVELLGIARLLRRRCMELSGGERQRVAIARALLTSPRLLLMDEPLAALDLASKTEILPFLERLHGELKIPVLYVSHSPDEVARLADRLVLMEAGRVRASGPVAEMLTRADLPLALGDDAEALIEATTHGYDPDYHLNYVDFHGGRFTVAGAELPGGTAVRLRVLARDVSLTLEPQQGTSILNIFPARVESISPINPSQVLVRLNTAGVPMLSRITRKSATALELTPGRQIYAQVKSVALLA